MKIALSKSKIEGQGCVAKVDITAGEIICQMLGEVISIPELQRRYTLGMERLGDPLQIAERLYLDMESPYVFINHSCQPNAYVRDSATLTALKNIRAGEEITFDYSMTEWTAEEFGGAEGWKMHNCRCGSANCRGTITSFPLLPMALQETYVKNHWVQNFILEKSCDLASKR